MLIMSHFANNRNFHTLQHHVFIFVPPYKQIRLGGNDIAATIEQVVSWTVL